METPENTENTGLPKNEGQEFAPATPAPVNAPIIPASRIDLTPLNEAVTKLKSMVGRVIVGQHETVNLLVVALLSNGHVLLEGVPGVAKTLTARLLAKAISVPFSRIQFTPDLMPVDVLGTSIFNLKTSEFEFKAGPIFSSMVLIDEINRAPAKTQSALFEVMEEHQVTVDGKTYKMREPFMVVATQNPLEHEGTYRLPEAQLDRFLFKLNVEYPGLDDERAILERAHNNELKNPLARIQAVISKEEIIKFRDLIGQIHVEPHLLTYISAITHQTRNDSALYLGASPRASLAILYSSKALAAINGRDFVTPEDLKAVIGPVLNHRIMLSPEKEMEGVLPADVIQRIVESVEVPR